LRCSTGRILGEREASDRLSSLTALRPPTPRHDLPEDRAQVPMRLALKNTLFLFAGYAALLLGLAAIAVFQLLVLEARVQKDTARLFARERICRCDLNRANYVRLPKYRPSHRHATIPR
jgi:hypothetical protein